MDGVCEGQRLSFLNIPHAEVRGGRAAEPRSTQHASAPHKPPLPPRHRPRQHRRDLRLRAAKTRRVRRRHVEGHVDRPAAALRPAPRASRPSPRVSGRIASGPASPASPSRRASERSSGSRSRRRSRTASRARRARRLWRTRVRPDRRARSRAAFPIPCPIGASAWLSARLDKPSASDFSTSCSRFPSTTERRNAVVIARPKPSASPCRSCSCARSGSACDVESFEIGWHLFRSCAADRLHTH